MNWGLISYQLRSNPGEWAVVIENGGSAASTAVNRIINGIQPWFRPAGAYFAVQRTIDGSLCVFAVYLGADHEYARKAGVTSLLRTDAA